MRSDLYTHKKLYDKTCMKKIPQVSQFTFALCSYCENKCVPSSFLEINNHFTLDYCEEALGGGGGDLGGK